MAIGTPASLGSATSITSSTTITKTVSAAAAVGDTIFVFVGCDDVNATLASVTDDAGNSYTINRQANTGASNTANTAIASALCTVALTSGVSVITATWTSAHTNKVIAVATVSGIAISAFDVSKIANGTGNSWSTGASLLTAQADEIAWAVCCNNAVGPETDTPAGTPTMTELFDFANANAIMLYVNYVILSATQAVTGDGTMTVSGGRFWNSLVATYRGTGAVPIGRYEPVPFTRGAGAGSQGGAR